MKLGIDFGTTRIVVSAADRGNYPLVPFETPDAVFDWFPPLIAIKDSDRRYGWDAYAMQTEPGWTIVRSLKRYLEDAGPQTQLDLGGMLVPLSELMLGMVGALRRAVQARFGESEILEVVLGVPANANSNQRFLTVDAFRRAGFSVLGLLNEPSAASIEFGHRQKTTGTILVYDLGGGTCDVSLVQIAAGTHTVLASEGMPHLGGDDFDLVLAEMAIGEEALSKLGLAEIFRLDEECRRQKEALHPNSRKIVVDLDVVEEGLGQATIAVADFYQRCRPLLAESIEATAQLAEGSDIEALYVTGGGVWDEILFPFDPALADARSFDKVPVEHSWPASHQEIEEHYSCDAAGVVTVAIRNLTSHYGREFRLGRWSGKTAVVSPKARKRVKKASS